MNGEEIIDHNYPHGENRWGDMVNYVMVPHIDLTETKFAESDIDKYRLVNVTTTKKQIDDGAPPQDPYWVEEAERLYATFI